MLAADPDANVAVLGDMNDFHLSPTNDVIEQGGVLVNLMETLPAAERYSYVFQGNSQDLDQFHASPALFERYSSFELVKINSEFFDQISDHDPNLAIFDFGDGTPIDLDPDPDPDPDPTPGEPMSAEFLQSRGNINAGQPVQVRFDVLDAEGVRVPSAELSVTLQAPDGVVWTQGYASNPSGMYRTLVRAETAGTHVLEVRTQDGTHLGSLEIVAQPPPGNPRG